MALTFQGEVLQYFDDALAAIDNVSDESAMFALVRWNNR